MITKLKGIHRRLLVGCAIFSALSLSIALAEYRDVSAGNVPAHINSWRQRITGQFGDYARAWSSTDVQIDRLYVELHTFSNDPGNEPTHSWQLKDAKAANVSNDTFALTDFAGEGGVDANGVYTCDYVSCYGTAWHQFTVLGSDYIYYSSDDGNHSSFNCWNVAGC